MWISKEKYKRLINHMENLENRLQDLEDKERWTSTKISIPLNHKLFPVNKILSALLIHLGLEIQSSQPIYFTKKEE